MPEQDRCSFIRRVRLWSVEEGGRVPTVALTALIGPEYRTRTLDAGFTKYSTKYSTKPICPDRMLEVVAQLARLQRSR